MADAETYWRKIRSVTEFTVTEEHLKLLRRAYVDWDPCEFGAPEINCKRPYGNSDVIDDIGEILGYEREHWDPRGDGDYNETVAENFTKIHAETALALQIALATGELKVGRYVCDEYRANWRPADEN